MPAPKAVLRDIADLSLDPNLAYNVTRSDGRLSTTRVHANPTVSKIRYAAPAEPALKSALVELPKVVEEPKVEEVQPDAAELKKAKIAKKKDAKKDEQND